MTAQAKKHKIRTPQVYNMFTWRKKGGKKKASLAGTRSFSNADSEASAHTANQE